MEQHAQVQFLHAKDQLMLRAAELSVALGCEVGLFVFAPSGGLHAFTSTQAPSAFLDRVKAEKLVELRTAAEVWKAYESGQVIFTEEGPARKRMHDMGRMGGPVKQMAADAGLMPPPPLPTHMMQRAPGTMLGPGQIDVVLGTSGQAVRLEGVRPAGFLDPRNFPLEPRTESAFAAISAELDRLSALLPSTSGAGTSGAGGTQGAGAAQSSGGKGNRFKPLSIMVPENQAPAIAVAGRGAAGTSEAGASGAGAAADQGTGAANLFAGSSGPLSCDGLGPLGVSGLLLSARGPGPKGDLPTPDSLGGLLSAGGAAGFLRWPSPRLETPGFSDMDSGGGEELADGGGLVVLGRSLSRAKMLAEAESAGGGGEVQQAAGSNANAGASAGATSAGAPTAAGSEGQGKGAIDIPLDV